MSSKCSDIGCFKSLLSNLINSTVLSVDQIGVVPWSLLLWIIWLFLHTIYKKIFQQLHRRLSVQEPWRGRLINVYWALAFTGVTIPFAFQNLDLSLYDARKRYGDILETEKWLEKASSPSVQTKISYVLLSGFYLNNICETCIERGFKNIEFLIHEFLAIFFITTFPLRCILFGIGFVLVINIEKLTVEIVKLTNTLGNISNSKVLHYISYGVFCLHAWIWSYFYLYIIPKYFLLKFFTKMKHVDDMQQLSVMLASTFSLWAFYVLDVSSSPFSKIMMNCLHSRMNTLENVLYENSHLFEEVSLNGTHPHDSDFVETRQENISSGNKKRENLLMLYHTVKCVIRIRRKLNRIRSKKNSLTEENGQKNSTPPQELLQNAEQNIKQQ